MAPPRGPSLTSPGGDNETGGPSCIRQVPAWTNRQSPIPHQPT